MQSKQFLSNIVQLQYQKGGQMFQYFSKNQPNIQRDVEKKCMICNKQFRFGKSEHQCKRCLRAVCADCGKEKITVFKLGFVTQAHRGCKHCVEEIISIKQYIKSNQLEFGRTSLVGDRWFKKIEKSHAYLTQDSRKAGEFKKDVFSKMWDSYNYSMREFVGLLTFQRSQQQIYAMMNMVLQTVLGTFPKENMESVSYLCMFLLCFCSADKAISLCQYLLELKNTVQSSGGLIDEYVKALGMAKEHTIAQYIKHAALRYVSSLSINYAHINSSIYVIEKVINRRKIEEVHMYFVLSVEGVKEYITQGKIDFSVIDLYLVRYCNPNQVSIKHRQLSSVNSAPFMRQEEQFRGRNNSDNKIISKPSENVTYLTDKQSAGSPLLKKDKQAIRSENQSFIKKYGDYEEPEPVDESMSMLSMIEQMKQLQKGNNEGQEGQFLSNLNKKEYRDRNYSERESGGDSFEVGRSGLSPSKTSKSSVSMKNKCSKCQESNKKVERLQQDMKEYLQLAKMLSFYQDENQQLKQHIKNLQKTSQSKQLRETSTRQNKLLLQNIQLDGQIRRLKKSLTEYQSKERQYESISVRYEENKRTIQKQEIQIRGLQMQLDESSMTIKMLKNKVETQSFKISTSQTSGERRQSDSTESSVADSKVIDILKQNVKEKNVQIEQLTKRNKLLTYQLEDINRPNKSDFGSQKSSSRGESQEIQRAAMVKKMNELSLLLMNEEDQKLRLSQEIFALKELLRENNISLQF